MRLDGKDSKAIALAHGLTRQRSAARLRPVLGFAPVEGGAELYATNGAVALRYRLEGAELAAPVQVAADPLRMILRDAGPVELQAADGRVTLEAEGARFTLPALEETMPQLERAHELTTGHCSMPVSLLSSIERRVSFAASGERTRYAMDGVRLELSAAGVRAVATDGKRLALVEEPMAMPDLAHGAGVVPVAALRLAVELAEALEVAIVDVRLTGSVISLAARGFEITARLVEGSYPPYEAVIPKSAAATLTIPREALTAALRRASVVVSKESRTVRWRFCGRCLTLSATTADIGSSSVALAIDYEGATLELGLNPEYMAHGLKAIGAEAVELDLSGPDDAVVIRGDGLLYVVMPVNLS